RWRGCRSRVRPPFGDEDRTTACLPLSIGEKAARDTEEPREVAVARIIGFEAADDPHEHVLRDVLGHGRIAGHLPEEPEDAEMVAPKERFGRRAVHRPSPGSDANAGEGRSSQPLTRNPLFKRSSRTRSLRSP